MEKHRRQEWFRFLNRGQEAAPAERQVHLICDNYATHKHAKGQAWEKRNPPFHFHFTPTRASWLNMEERSFRDLTTHRIRRRVFTPRWTSSPPLGSVRSFTQPIPNRSFRPPGQRTSSKKQTAAAQNLISYGLLDGRHTITRWSFGLGADSQLEATNVVRGPPPLQSRGMRLIKHIAIQDDPIKPSQRSSDPGSVT